MGFVQFYTGFCTLFCSRRFLSTLFFLPTATSPKAPLAPVLASPFIGRPGLDCLRCGDRKMNNNCYPCIGNKLLPMSWFVETPTPSLSEGGASRSERGGWSGPRSVGGEVTPGKTLINVSVLNNGIRRLMLRFSNAVFSVIFVVKSSHD